VLRYAKSKEEAQVESVSRAPIGPESEAIRHEGTVNGNGHQARDSAVRIQSDRLKEFVASALERTGVPAADAAIVSDCLVDADLRGIPSHGVSRLTTYIDALQRGFSRVKPQIRLHRTGQATAVVDGDNGLGSLVAVMGMRQAIDLSNESGIGMVAVRHSSHFGHAGYYASLAAANGCIGIVFSNAFPTVAPFGGREAMLGTNPIAVAAPGGDRPDFALDMSTSITSRGWLRLAAEDNAPIPEGWGVTKDGAPALTPREAISGILLPFGGYKGSGVALMVDLVAGVLTGAGFGQGVRSMYVPGERHADVGHALIAIRISAFLKPSEYQRRYRMWYDALKRTRPAQGYDAILIPGERSAAIAQRQQREGIYVDAKTWRSLKQLAESIGIDICTDSPRAVNGSSYQ
jgi:LDH2 family malate/lactate/ureidoglycolate dehydrogenase